MNIGQIQSDILDQRREFEEALEILGWPGAYVSFCGTMGIITTLEFLQHLLA
jgi:hypothetical protein